MPRIRSIMTKLCHEADLQGTTFCQHDIEIAGTAFIMGAEWVKVVVLWTPLFFDYEQCHLTNVAGTS